MGITQKALLSLRHYGVRRTLQQARRHLIPGFIFDTEVLRIYRFDFSDLADEPPYPWPLRWGSKDDRDALLQGGLPVSLIDHLFEIGGRPILVEDGDVTIAYSWIVPNGWDTYDWLRFEVSADEIWGAMAFVVPEYRGKKVGPMMKSWAYSRLVKEGYLRAWTLVEKRNVVSGRSASKVPQRVVGEISYVRLFGLTVAKVGPNWRIGTWHSSNRLVVPVEVFK